MFVARSHAEAHVTPAEIRAYVKKHIGGQSAPAWVWFLGEEGVATEFPKTASGKIQKVRALYHCDYRGATSSSVVKMIETLTSYAFVRFDFGPSRPSDSAWLET